jgi:hypothetical protein
MKNPGDKQAGYLGQTLINSKVSVKIRARLTYELVNF